MLKLQRKIELPKQVSKRFLAKLNVAILEVTLPTKMELEILIVLTKRNLLKIKHLPNKLLEEEDFALLPEVVWVGPMPQTIKF